MIGRPLRTLIAASLLVLLSAYGVDAATVHTQTIYRPSAFSTQATDDLCTAAVVQNIRNLATGESRTSRAEQTQLYALGRAHNLYRYARPGVDPLGTVAMLEASIPGTDWREVRKTSLQAVLRLAVRQMRATGLPAVLFVGGGRHVWTMNGYTSTRDPASGASFAVTHVRFSGPLFPKQKARYGWYDLAPNTLRSVERLSRVYFPYRNLLAFGGRRSTPWNGYYVAVIPWSVDDPDPGETPPPTPDPGGTPSPPPDPTVEPSPEAEAPQPPAALPEPEPQPEPEPEPAALAPPP